MNQSVYLYRNSLIHKLNPSLKIVIMILLIIIIFIPFGLLYQLIVLGFLTVVFFVAKLPFSRFIKIFFSIILMILILSVINWAAYKTPGVIFDFYKNNSTLGINYEWLRNVKPGEKLFLVGDLWGGEIVQNPPFHDIYSNKLFPIANAPKGFFEFVGEKSELRQITEYFSKEGIRYESFANSDTSYYLFLYKTRWYAFSSYALILVISVSIKIFSMILIVTILVLTTSSIELTYAFEDLLSPLKIFKAPVNEWSMIIALSIRFIPSLIDESSRVLNAQASRGVDFKNGNFNDKVKSLVSLIVPLFSIAFRKADDLANAMEARAYNPILPRTRYRFYKIKYYDLLILAFIAIIFGIFLFLSFYKTKIILSPFGLYDVLYIANK